jgi:hypothetical protein
MLFYYFARVMAMAMVGVEVVKILGEGVIMNLVVLIKTPALIEVDETLF